jgi:hypothetical protein
LRAQAGRRAIRLSYSQGKAGRRAVRLPAFERNLQPITTVSLFSPRLKFS